MDPDKEKVIGVVGGMGPQAGIALVNSIISQTNAITDQQHLSTILMSFPRHIVDRTAFLEGQTSINPGHYIAGVIKKLEYAGAQVVGIACNTSHCPAIFYIILEELERMNSQVILLHMPEEVCRSIKEYDPYARRIGLMTTTGTYKSGVYPAILQEWGFEVVMPDLAFQDAIIHRIIYDKEFGLKANTHEIRSEVVSLVEHALQFFLEKEVDVLVLGCTELSMVAGLIASPGLSVVDSTHALAAALIREAIGNRKHPSLKYK